MLLISYLKNLFYEHNMNKRVPQILHVGMQKRSQLSAFSST